MVPPTIKHAFAWLGVIFFLAGPAVVALAQDSDEPVRIFYDTRAVSGHSTELSAEGQMKMIISHRFGQISGGAYELFGLDQANIRIGFDYGISDKFNIGVGRSSQGKTIDGFAKYGLMQQRDGGSPIALTLLGSASINGLRQPDDRENKFAHRMTYVVQALAARRVSDRLSVMITPSYTHRNLVANDSISHDVLALGGTARYLLNKRLTVTGQYFYVAPNQLEDRFTNFLGIGLDLETKGHVFQFYFGNSRGMQDALIITETTGSWMDGDIHFGFNITRDFQVRAKRRH
ncbi:MAG: DUF5777 family beta-barrel protein [Saprospiraceae bacterium]